MWRPWADRTVARMTNETATSRTSTSTLGRLGAWAADHRRRVVILWAVVVLCLGSLAPFADRALSGAGWEAPNSESGDARRAIESSFPGQGTYALSVVVSAASGHGRSADASHARQGDARASQRPRGERGARAAAGRRRLARRPDRDRHRPGGRGPSEMVEAAGRLKGRLAALSSAGITVRLTGPAAMWSDFNHANKTAMMKSEALSWPLTLTLLVLAFGTLVAAGLPLLLTSAGLVSAGGLLFLAGQLLDVSIWAMNFAMMFAIALGIDYALFLVVRFRGALAAGLSPRDATVAHDGHGRQGRARERAHRGRRADGGHARPGSDLPLRADRDRPGRPRRARRDAHAAARRAVRARRAGQRRPDPPAQRVRPSQRALRRLGPPALGATAALRRRRGADPRAPRGARARAADGDADDHGRAARRRLTRRVTRSSSARSGRARRAGSRSSWTSATSPVPRPSSSGPAGSRP